MKNIFLLVCLFTLLGSTVNAMSMNEIKTEEALSGPRYYYNIYVNLFGKEIFHTGGCYTLSEVDNVINNLRLQFGNLIQLLMEVSEEECSI